METTGVCACLQQQYGPIIFQTVAYQRSANTVYNANVTAVAAATAGTRSSPNGNPVFKSHYERMQFLSGKIGAGGNFGVQPKTFTLGTN